MAKRPRPTPRTPKLLLFSQYGRSPHPAETSDPVCSLPGKQPQELLRKGKYVYYKIPRRWQPTKLQQKSEHVLIDPANVGRNQHSGVQFLGRIHYTGWGLEGGEGRAAFYIFVSICTRLLFGLRLIRDTLYYRPSACSICVPAVTLSRAFQNYIQHHVMFSLHSFHVIYSQTPNPTCGT